MTTDCFRTLLNEPRNVSDFGDIPCGSTSNGFSQCCRKGEKCLEDNICHFTRGGAGLSGYYIASCTDESGKDPSCLQTCSGNAEPDIVYIETDGLWHCCKADSDNGGVPNCSAPTSETFQAPAPEKLADFASTSISTSTSTSITASSGTSSPSTSSLPSSSASSTPTSSSTPNSNSGLSTGAKAGIGVGVALGALCVVLLSIIIFLMKKRQRRQQKTIPPDDASKGLQEEGKGGTGTAGVPRPPGDRQNWHELQGQVMKSELDASRNPLHEVEGRG